MAAKHLLGVTLFVAMCFSVMINGTELSRSKRASNDAVSFAVRQAVDGFKILLKHGIPELGIQSLEPAKLEDFVYDGSSHGTKVKSNFTSMSLFGLSNLEIAFLSIDMAKLKLDLELKFSNLTINGHYNLTGKMLKLFPIHGNDKFELTATDVKVEGKSTLKTFSNGSLALTDLKLEMDVDKVKVHFHKLNGGGSASGTLNTLINFFGKRIFDEAKPKLLQRMKTALETTINRKLATINVFKV